jgi:hypothetical protein
MLGKVDAISTACSLGESPGQNVIDVGKLEVFLGSEVKKIAEGEVRELHEVADWLHDVPTQVLKGSKCNDTELADTNRGSRNAHSKRFATSTGLKASYDCLRLSPGSLLFVQHPNSLVELTVRDNLSVGEELAFAFACAHRSDNGSHALQ